MSLAGKSIRKFKRAIGYSESMSVPEDDQKLLETIRKHVELDSDATDLQRELELDDLRFCDPSTQWSDSDRDSRESNGRPCLTEDRLGPFLSQVVNEQRKNKPGVQVNPVDDSGDVDTAEVIQGLIRHIEYNSNADTAYDTAFEWAVRVGRGFYRVCTDYINEDGFEQEIRIKRIPNIHNVFVDPAAEEADYSDMKWGGFKTWMSQEDFKAAYPDSKTAVVGTDAWKSIGDDAPEWMNADGSACMVVEYFYQVQKSVKRYLLADGSVVEKLPLDELGNPVKPKDTRDAFKTEVKWVKCTAVEILERGDWASKYIPIVAVLGKEVLIDGKRTYAGLIRPGKDPQKRHNYLITSQIERIAFMPLATWLGAKGFMGKNKGVWKDAHKNQVAALEFEIIGDDGQGINAPRLITEEAPIVAVSHALEGAEAGFKAVLGMYDANIGNRQGGESGIAIGRLQAQGETGNFHFQDNLSRALRYEGRIICDLIPTIYDTERVIRIIGEDGTQKTTRVNAPLQPGEAVQSEENTREGMRAMYDLTTGKYDVTVSAGPSYQSKRAEDRAVMLGMLTGPMGQLITTAMPDLFLGTLDTPLAKKMAARAKKTLPPPLQDQPQGGPPPVPPEIQQKIEQSGQMIDQLTKALHEALDKAEDAEGKRDLEWKKALLAAQTSITVAEIGAKSKEDLTAFTEEMKEIKHQREMLALKPDPDMNESPEGGEAGPVAGTEAPAPETAGPMAGMEE